MTNKNSKILPDVFNNRVLARNGALGKDACKIMAAAIQAVNPYDCIKDRCQLAGKELIIGNKKINLEAFDRTFLIGFGKASVPMSKALIDILGENIISAQVITKDSKFLEDNEYKNKLKIFLGNHPVPSNNSLISTEKILESLPELTAKDLVLIVISGGGSALLTKPVMNVTLEELQEMTQILLNCGADIHEINTLRKHLDQVKGGRLALSLQPALIHTFILSDVIGDRLDMIASGPTVPDPTTYHDALNIVDKYDLTKKIPQSIIDHLVKGKQGEISESFKPGKIEPDRVINHLVGTNIKAAEAAKQQAQLLGYSSQIISSFLTGLTKNVAEFLDSIITTEISYGHPLGLPACLIFGGETTVKVVGDGLGGRNQDLVLRMVERLAGKNGVLFISLATDGEDGPTDAAGAASDALVLREGDVLFGLTIDTYIDTCNSYQYFSRVGGLIKTGSTGTNVNDLVIILVEELDGAD